MPEAEFSSVIITHFKEIYCPLDISHEHVAQRPQMDLRFLENDIFVETSKIPWLMVD